MTFELIFVKVIIGGHLIVIIKNKFTNIHMEHLAVQSSEPYFSEILVLVFIIGHVLFVIIADKIGSLEVWHIQWNHAQRHKLPNAIILNPGVKFYHIY